MKQEKDYHADIKRGEQAKAILNSPLIVNYFDEKRKTIMHNLETCKYWENPEERDALLNMLRCLSDFEKDFKKHMQHGQKAKSLLEKLLKGKS